MILGAGDVIGLHSAGMGIETIDRFMNRTIRISDVLQVADQKKDEWAAFHMVNILVVSATMESAMLRVLRRYVSGMGSELERWVQDVNRTGTMDLDALGSAIADGYGYSGDFYETVENFLELRSQVRNGNRYGAATISRTLYVLIPDLAYTYAHDYRFKIDGDREASRREGSEEKEAEACRILNDLKDFAMRDCTDQE